MSEERQLQTYGASPMSKPLMALLGLEEARLTELLVRMHTSYITVSAKHQDGALVSRDFGFNPAFWKQILKALGMGENERATEFSLDIEPMTYITTTVKKLVDQRFLDVDWSVLKPAHYITFPLPALKDRVLDGHTIYADTMRVETSALRRTLIQGADGLAYQHLGENLDFAFPSDSNHLPYDEVVALIEKAEAE